MKLKPTNINFTSSLTSMPDVFFLLVEEQSDRASEAGQVSQPVGAEAGGPVQADHTSIFWGGKVNVCRCNKF